MSERKPAGMSYGSWIDEQIRQAEERGAFDDLPGTGKPLPKRNEDAAQAWLREYLRREGISADELLPAPLKLRKEIERLTETAAGLRSEEQVREVARELNHRIVQWRRFPSGPPVFVPLADTEAMVQRWRDAHRPPGAEPGRPGPAEPGDGPATAPPPSRSGSSRWWSRRRGLRAGGRREDRRWNGSSPAAPGDVAAGLPARGRHMQPGRARAGAGTDKVGSFFQGLAAAGHVATFEGQPPVTLRFDLTDGAAADRWYVSVSNGDVEVTRRDRPADAVARTERRNFEAMAAGRMNAQAAMLRGLLACEGSMAALVMFQRCLPGPPGSTGRVAPITGATVTAARRPS